VGETQMDLPNMQKQQELEDATDLQGPMNGPSGAAAAEGVLEADGDDESFALDAAGFAGLEEMLGDVVGDIGPTDM
jgi:hypothetical protein